MAFTNLIFIDDLSANQIINHDGIKLHGRLERCVIFFNNVRHIKKDEHADNDFIKSSLKFLYFCEFENEWILYTASTADFSFEWHMNIHSKYPKNEITLQMIDGLKKSKSFDF